MKPLDCVDAANATTHTWRRECDQPVADNDGQHRNRSGCVYHPIPSRRCCGREGGRG
jgi:hypothetical protein